MTSNYTTRHIDNTHTRDRLAQALGYRDHVHLKARAAAARAKLPPETRDTAAAAIRDVTRKLF